MISDFIEQKLNRVVWGKRDVQVDVVVICPLDHLPGAAPRFSAPFSHDEAVSFEYGQEFAQSVL
jgi:phosphopantetheinyl transferase